MNLINETTTTATTTNIITTSSSSVRGASRKNRVYIFREWLIRNYGSYLHQQQQQQQQQQRNESSHDDDDDDDNGILILDVAGGKGDLSWLLNNVDGFESMILDPWKQQQDGSTPTRNERMVKSIEFLGNNPDERAIRSVRGLSTYQPLAELIPKLFKQRSKRLSNTDNNNNNNNNNNKSGGGEYHQKMLLSSEPLQKRPVTTEGRNGSCSNSSTTEISSCCVRPEDFVTPQLLQIPLNNEIVNQVKSRLIICKKNKSENDNNKDGVHNDDAIIAEEREGVDEDDEKMISILTILSSGRIKLIVGFHPDQATESCIDLAKILNIPFCIVPCCVFPSEFPNRRLILKEEEQNVQHQQQQQQQQLVPVRTYSQFLKYLRQKPTTTTTNEVCSNGNSSKKILTAYLDFHFTETAKNVVLYTLPPPPEED